TGRWSHWSVPIQFVAGEPAVAGIRTDLRVTELMYNPPHVPGDAFADNEEYEFIELKHIGDEMLDLSGVALTDGVTFDFADGGIVTLEPGGFVLVVRNESAFLSRYGTDLAPLIAGEYGGKLANGGENVKLVDSWAGTIAEFQYSDGTDWPIKADGAGHSLVPVDPANLAATRDALDDPGNWRASTHVGGSPGADDPETETAQVDLAVTASTWVRSQ
ncbi:MAG: lamin tail domain-containing protein, partial [Phycisphaerales bacterium]